MTYTTKYTYKALSDPKPPLGIYVLTPGLKKMTG